ncbi:amino acid racemase [Bradyrhizobium sp. 176]|uniref:aspartate/glutamate racemase family protein n=1 Tax=unclassified Bradyrhizobium TaxID=2631580 RepID=UPI001FF7AF8C|nr:amino acid racemase [Bradyrhizobium sp. 176]MCK1555664.1 amino acid racemase [Bradyrhizobium sp. 171]
MKKIGMIGGLSWVSTAEYYKRINEITRSKAGGVTSARIVLESVNRQEYVTAVIDRNDEAAACRQIAKSASMLQAAGADFIIIACNDVHRFVPVIQPMINIPFLHIAQVTAEAVKARGLKRVAILGVRKTMECDFYPKIFAQNGLDAIIPSEPQRKIIHDSIYEELVHNRFLDATRERYQSIIADLAARGADSVALACTEIPLLLSQEQSPLPAFSTTELHCQSAVAHALAGQSFSASVNESRQ